MFNSNQQKLPSQYGEVSVMISSHNQSGKITKITNSQNTKRTYGQLNEQLFPKR